MTLRADHVAGAFFIGVGLLIIALSGDLPSGTLSLPGSGFLPKIVAVLMIFFGAGAGAARERKQAFRDGGMERRPARRPWSSRLPLPAIAAL